MRVPHRMRPLLLLTAVVLMLVSATSVVACAPAEVSSVPTLPPAPLDTEVPADLATATFADG